FTIGGDGFELLIAEVDIQIQVGSGRLVDTPRCLQATVVVEQVADAAVVRRRMGTAMALLRHEMDRVEPGTGHDPAGEATGGSGIDGPDLEGLAAVPVLAPVRSQSGGKIQVGGF